jgi:SAM-dependent methyltransferase
MPKENMREYYNARAPEYEQIYYREIPARRQEIADEVTRLEKLAAERDVIDLACGTGYWTEVLARRAKSVLAVDAAPEMIAQAKTKKYVAPVELIVSDMFTAGEEQAYDLVSSGFWFSHQPRQDWQKFFDLLKRLIRPNGLIWVIDNNPPAEGSKQESLGNDEHGNNYKRRRLDDGTEYTILKNYFSEAEIRDIFSAQFKLEELKYGEYYWSVVFRP